MPNTITLWNGRSVPRIGVGTWAAGGAVYSGDKATIYGEVNDARSDAALRLAYEMGCRVFDTAPGYGSGNAELILGRALSGKDDAFIVTKVGYFGDPVTRQSSPPDTTPGGVRRTVEGSLKRLQRDQVDIVLLHLNEYPVDQAGEVFDTMAQLRDEGKIAGFGWSTDHPERLAPFAGRDGFVAVENDFNVFTPAREVMAIAEREGLVSLSRLPLAMGLLTGKYRPGQKIRADDVKGGNAEWLRFFKQGEPNADYLKRLDAIRDLLRTDGRTLAQGALGWILAASAVALPLPGFTTPEQVADNLGALDKGPLPATVMAEIAAVLAAR
jgi:aryl-alcohol dehydrogenase-like predicted oxidoreductase